MRKVLFQQLSIVVKIAEAIINTNADVHLMIRLTKQFKRVLNYIIGPLLGLWLFYSLYSQVRHQQGVQEAIHQMSLAPFESGGWKFWIGIILLFVNWGIEARKWQLILTPLLKIKYFSAVKGVLSGVTLSINTPNRIGEYGGRILYLPKDIRLKAISFAIAASISQLIITLVMGGLGLIYVMLTLSSSTDNIMGLPFFWIRIILLFTVVAALFLIILYFRLSYVPGIVQSVFPLNKFSKHLVALREIPAKILLRLLSLSFVRYMVFVIQYILLLQLVKVDVSWGQGLWVISILFLVLAIIPSFAIADLGIRGKFSTELLLLYSTNTVGIIGATFGIWFINLFIPAIAGAVLIARVKIFQGKANGN